MSEPVVVTFLEMLEPSWLVPAGPRSPFDLRQVREPCPALSRFLYREVGGAWQWTERLSWDEEAWMRWLDRPQLETWLALVEGNPIGYSELEADGDEVQIAYFGLLPQFIGRGYGGALLSRVIERAWAMGAGRLWVHTCSLDHPAALANYEKRGFRQYQQKVVEPWGPSEVEST